LHNERSRVFQEFKIAKSRLAGTSDNVTDLADKWRSIVSEPISAIDPRYGELNKRYAQLIQPLKKFTKYTGFDGDIEKANLDALKIAEKAYRLTGNASATPAEIFGDLADAAKREGIFSDVDIKKMLQFDDELQKQFGIQARGSLAGAVSRGTSDATGVLDSAITGGISGAGAAILKKAMVGTREEKIKALADFLKTLE
jgi:hypothetical protein